MAKRNKRKPMAEINVVPYIDVTLVLLVIFMITQPLLTQGVKVELPQAETETMDVNPADTVIAKVNLDGDYFLTIGSNEEKPVSSNELIEQVQAQLTINPQSSILVAGDERTEYQLVMNLLAILNNAGVPKVGLMTRPYQEVK